MVITEEKTSVECDGVRFEKARWNTQLLQAVGVARGVVKPNQEVFVQLNDIGLAVIKRGTKCGVTDGTRMVLNIEFESVVIVENGWLVACKYGCYTLYNKEGKMYKGLVFLKKSNAIRFARTL